MHEYEEDMLATPMDAVREWVSVVGANHPDRAWLCHDYDVWVANPWYVGPPVRHPEDYDEDFEQGDYVAAVPNEDGEFDEDNHPVHAMETADDVPF